MKARLDALLDLVGPHGLSGIEDIVERRRRQAELSAMVGRSVVPEGVEVQDHVATSGTASRPDLRLRIYRPRSGTQPAPCVYYVHGGGLVSGGVVGDDAKAATLARDADCVVASVEYRLAPEHPYPAAFDDCVTGLRWLTQHHHELDLDPRRFALYGTSAGGGLAAAATHYARDRNGPQPACLMLVSPMLDDRCGSESTRTNTGFGAWSREATLQAWGAYLGEDAGTDRIGPYAAPARATDLTGFPPTFIDTGDLDLFRDESLEFAQRLMWAGVPVELHVHPGSIHGGESLAPKAEVNVRARSLRVAALRRALHAGRA